MTFVAMVIEIACTPQLAKEFQYFILSMGAMHVKVFTENVLRSALKSVQTVYT